MERYLYTDETDVFFFFLPEELHEWLPKLTDGQGTWRINDTIVWTPKVVRCLEASGSNITQAMDHWIDRTLGCFVTDFMIDRNISYSEAE